VSDEEYERDQDWRRAMTPDEAAASRPVPWVHTPMADMLTLAREGRIAKPVLSVGTILDAPHGLFYPGKVNGLAGESGAGKSWIVLQTALDEARKGNYTVWVDYEDSADTLALRMSELDWDADLGGMIIHVAAVGKAEKGLALLGTLISEYAPTLTVFDSTGEALAGEGVNPNADEEVAKWFQILPRPLADLGPAVVLLDHMVKADDGGLWPIGTQRKRAAINGIQYVLRSIKTFSRKKAGRVRMICAKDRGGHHEQGASVVEVAFDPIASCPGDGCLLVGVWSAHAVRLAPDGGWRPTGLMEKVSVHIEHHEGQSQTTLVNEVGGKAKDVRRALEVLAQERFIRVEVGPRNAQVHFHVRPFREADDPDEVVMGD
jgi:hypothetical protein